MNDIILIIYNEYNFIDVNENFCFAFSRLRKCCISTSSVDFCKCMCEMWQNEYRALLYFKMNYIKFKGRTTWKKRYEQEILMVDDVDFDLLLRGEQ